MYNVEGKWERGCSNKGRDNEGQSINNYWAQREVGKKSTNTDMHMFMSWQLHRKLQQYGHRFLLPPYHATPPFPCFLRPSFATPRLLSIITFCDTENAPTDFLCYPGSKVIEIGSSIWDHLF